MSLQSSERKAWKNYQAKKTHESLQAWQQEYSQFLQETPETFRQVLNALAVLFIGIVMLLSIIIYIRWG